MSESRNRNRKKICCLLLLTATGFAGVLGCGANGTEQETDSEAGWDEIIEEFISGENTSVMESIYGEQEKYPQLAEFLASYYSISEEQKQHTRYYYNYMDLNEDGTEEIFAIILSEELEESDGEPLLLLLTAQDGEFAVLEDFGKVHTPIVIRDAMTNGWHDIQLRVYGKGQEDGYLICHYQTEGGYQTEENEFLEELEEPVSGVQILSNNLIDDMDNNRYLSLGGD